MEIFKSVDKDGTIYYKNKKGQYHREDGPAVLYSNGTKVWSINGLIHREDGPAIEYPGGYSEYRLSNIRYTKEDWEEEIIKIKLKRIKEL